MDRISCVRASVRFADSYGRAVRAVARERRYLAATNGYPGDATLRFVDRIEREDLAQYFALQAGTVVGWCDVLPREFEGMRHVGVLGMGVVADFRGRGIGSRLLELALEHARSRNGVEKVELEVFESNQGALRLYERWGFVVEGKRTRARKIDGVYDNIILMGREWLPEE